MFLIGLLQHSTLSAQSVSEIQKIVASDKASGDEFGNSVSISGVYAIVGAHKQDSDSLGGATLNEAGAAYIYKKSSNNYILSGCIHFMAATNWELTLAPQ